MKAPIFFFSAALLLMAFFITDCSVGRSDLTQAIVTGHNYVPERHWTTTSVEDGHIKIEHHSSPEEWHVTLDNGWDLGVTRADYNNAQRGRKYFVGYRIGKWTGIRYCKHFRFDLNENQPTEKQ